MDVEPGPVPLPSLQAPKPCWLLPHYYVELPEQAWHPPSCAPATHCLGHPLSVLLTNLATHYLRHTRPQDLRSVDQLPVEIELGPDFVFRSIFACPVSRDSSAPDNPPMLLPCGHVLCEQSVQRLAKQRSRYGGYGGWVGRGPGRGRLWGVSVWGVPLYNFTALCLAGLISVGRGRVAGPERRWTGCYCTSRSTWLRRILDGAARQYGIPCGGSQCSAVHGRFVAGAKVPRECSYCPVALQFCSFVLCRIPVGLQLPSLTPRPAPRRPARCPPPPGRPSSAPTAPRRPSWTACGPSPSPTWPRRRETRGSVTTRGAGGTWQCHAGRITFPDMA